MRLLLYWLFEAKVVAWFVADLRPSLAEPPPKKRAKTGWRTERKMTTAPLLIYVSEFGVITYACE